MSKPIHSFHVPVMGTAFSIDTPLKVARYGIHSVISLVDDTLIEQMRKFYCEKEGEAYTPITKYDEDFRAQRITASLDLANVKAHRNFPNLKAFLLEPAIEIPNYFNFLPINALFKAPWRQILIQTDP